MPIEPKNLEELQNKLMDEKKRVENELFRIAKPTGMPGDYETRFNNIGTDVDENATEVEEYSDNLALENTLEKELKKINSAIEKINNTGYGICKNCHQEIDIERLQAYPAAENCIKCKQEMSTKNET